MEQGSKKVHIEISRKQAGWLLAGLVFTAALLRLMVAYTSVNYFDLFFYVDWSAGAVEDLFGAYEKVANLDYPPLFLFPLYLTGKLMQDSRISGFDPYAMLVLKGWQMLFDLGLVLLLYFVLRRKHPVYALGAAALWAVNPTAIYNCAYWGQTDSIMLFLLVLAFWLLEGKRAMWAGCVMALACLMKFQSLYFAPLFLLILVMEYPVSKVVETALMGGATVLAVFFPFILRSGWGLPWEIYFGGFSQYPGASLNAFNLYTALGLNYVRSDAILFWKLTAEDFSNMIILAAILALAALYLTAKEKSAWILGFFFMQTIFLFTTRMHERYQIPVLVMALLAAAYHRSIGMFWSYLSLTGMTFLNHFLVLQDAFAGDRPQAWMLRFDEMAKFLSGCNLILYLLTACGVLWIIYQKRAGCGTAGTVSIWQQWARIKRRLLQIDKFGKKSES